MPRHRRKTLDPRGLIGQNGAMGAKDCRTAKTIPVLLISGIFAVFAGIAAAKCQPPSHGAAFLQAIPQNGIDQTLFAEALQKEANFVRCRGGVGQLGIASGLTRAAAGHAGWMATHHKLSHDGDRRFKARMRASGVKYKLAAENIASYERYAFPTGSFKISNQAKCRFTSQTGATIAAHSYASLARRVVQGWMASSGHRRNLLNRRLKLSGAGIGFDASADFCGRYYISQSYAG